MGFPRKFPCFGRAKIEARAIDNYGESSRLNFCAAKTSKFGRKPDEKASYGGYGDYFEITELLCRLFIVDRARCKLTGRSAVEVNIENERFTVVC